jgi:lipopolysaccharide biosynthesis regulator YciM
VFAANSLSAAAHLGYNDQSDRQAALLHGKLYIAAGEFARAVEVLKPSVVGAKDPVQVREELIAAFVGLERYGEALAVLHRIPEAERGPELSTLKVFLERKLSGSPLSEQSSSR